MVDDSWNEKERFDWLIEEIAVLIEAGLEPPSLKEEDSESLIACTSLVRLAFHHAQAVKVLLDHGLFESVAPLARTIYEIWVDLRYILHVGDRVENSRRLMINASMEVTEFALRRRRLHSNEEIRGCLRALRSYRSDFPDTYRVIRDQRRSRKFHWSGLSRSALIRKFAPDNTFYSYLSWETHAVVSPVRDVSVSGEGEESPTFSFQSIYDPDEQVDLHSFTVGGMLYNVWNDYADCFGLGQVLLEDDEEGQEWEQGA